MTRHIPRDLCDECLGHVAAVQQPLRMMMVQTATWLFIEGLALDTDKDRAEIVAMLNLLSICESHLVLARRGEPGFAFHLGKAVESCIEAVELAMCLHAEAPAAQTRLHRVIQLLGQYEGFPPPERHETTSSREEEHPAPRVDALEAALREALDYMTTKHDLREKWERCRVCGFAWAADRRPEGVHSESCLVVRVYALLPTLLPTVTNTGQGDTP